DDSDLGGAFLAEQVGGFVFLNAPHHPGRQDRDRGVYKAGNPGRVVGGLKWGGPSDGVEVSADGGINAAEDSIVQLEFHLPPVEQTGRVDGDCLPGEVSA